MKFYPVIVHKDKKSAYGVSIPDLPGCFSAGATLDEALRNVQEAIEVHLHGEDIAPEPSNLDRWKLSPDYRDAYTITLAPVDLSFMNDLTVRVNITARKSELAIVDRAAKSAHMDRSTYLVVSAIERARRGTSGVPVSEQRPAKVKAVPQKVGSRSTRRTKGSLPARGARNS